MRQISVHIIETLNTESLSGFHVDLDFLYVKKTDIIFSFTLLITSSAILQNRIL